LLHVDPGFRVAHLLAMDVGLPGSKYPSGQRAAAVYTEILERLRRLRGVVAVGATQRLPIVGQPYGESFQIEGRPMRTPGDLLPTQYRVVTPGYFNTMQIPLKQGRYLTEQDSVNSPCAVVVNQTFVRLYFSDSPVLGRRVTLDDPREGPWCSVVGIVAAVRHFGLAAELEPEVYVSYRRDPKRFMTLVLRTVGDPLRLASAARAEIHAFDKELIPEHVVTMDQVIATSLSERWLTLLSLGLLAGLALLLASVGLYGVVAYSVSRRSQELGIRAALGASRSALMILVLGETLQLVLAGIGAGLAAALSLTRLMQNLLYGVPATDPLTFIAVVALLVGITIAASYLPARRAARVDPMEALRYE
jgi:predicted permease